VPKVCTGDAKKGFTYSCNPSTGNCEEIPDPGGGAADDNVELGGTVCPSTSILDTATGIGVLSNGFHVPMSSLAGKLGNGYVPVDIGFSPDIVSKHPLLVISSGGLFGLENSALFRAKLDEYVKRGGTLLVFSQHHGYEFSALPVPQEADGTYRRVKGYGWDEDQNCFADAGRLFAYTIRDAVPAGEKVLVATALKFRTEVPPKTTSSLHSFSMKMDGAFCRIADITPMSPPAPSRQPGGSFPSE
jgi:hypothetical protein